MPAFRGTLVACALHLPAGAIAQRAANDSLALPAVLATGSYELEDAYQFNQAFNLTAPPGVTDTLYVGERSGRIYIVTRLATGARRPAPFLDLSGTVTTNGENGLLGLSFHPDYAANGYLFVYYTLQVGGQARNRVSRFTRSVADPFVADRNTELILIDQRDDANNHNGGDIHFGPDGYLYIATGDEGLANDSLDNSQRVDKDLFAGMLRLDVDRLPGNIEPTLHAAIPRDGGGLAAYRIPKDNPLVARWQAEGASPNSSLRLEFSAIGLRNPWRFSFDSKTGKLWLGDVGQGSREEINLVEIGGNYGWATREGLIAGPKTQTPPPGFETFSDPIYDYPRSVGGSITGGVVYRGLRLPELHGAYIYGDYVSGRVFALFAGENGENAAATQIASFPSHYEYGVDPSNGDVLVSGGSNSVKRLVRGAGSSGTAFPAKLSETGAFKNLNTLEPEDGLYPYEPNVSFWSDHAIKSRWVSIPGESQVAYRPDAPWTFPQGSVWVKHFELETTRGDPATRRRVETRFLVKTDRAAYGISYRWNEAGTEAFLADESGEEIAYQIIEDGEVDSQTWRIPSRQECMQCHTEAAGFALSFNARQLNRTSLIDGQERNALEYFSEIGILDTPIANAETLPRFYRADEESVSLEKRARSYLAVNCVACHQPGGGALMTWDARPELTLAETGLIDGVANDHGGDASRRLAIRGHPERSIVIDRAAARNGFARMPPIGSNILDTQGIELLTRWLNLVPPVAQTFEQWQTAQFGSASDPRAAAGLDPDGDGNSNRLEYLNRTGPLDPASVWRPIFERSDASLSVRFPMAPGRAFTVSASDDLSAWTDWQASGNPPSSDALETLEASVTGGLPDNEGRVFLRVEVAEP